MVVVNVRAHGNSRLALTEIHVSRPALTLARLEKTKRRKKKKKKRRKSPKKFVFQRFFLDEDVRIFISRLQTGGKNVDAQPNAVIL